jgi:hypothetical protein
MKSTTEDTKKLAKTSNHEELNKKSVVRNQQNKNDNSAKREGEKQKTQSDRWPF